MVKNDDTAIDTNRVYTFPGLELEGNLSVSHPPWWHLIQCTIYLHGPHSSDAVGDSRNLVCRKG